MNEDGGFFEDVSEMAVWGAINCSAGGLRFSM